MLKLHLESFVCVLIKKKARGRKEIERDVFVWKSWRICQIGDGNGHCWSQSHGV